MRDDFFVVPKEGLEPSQLAPHAPETCVSTNFTTSANRIKVDGPSFCLWSLNFHLLVPRTGLEPAHLAALPPQSSVSTNFTTWA